MSEQELSYREITEDVLQAMEPPRALWWVVMVVLAGGIGTALLIFLYQVLTGMTVTGLSIPVGWAVYIGNFVFWVGIAHSGTLISAILYLVRARWRSAVSRSAEAMTVFAVLTAGLFPLIHLGRLWAFYYILPYPSQRQIWPNFISPLVWDVCAVSTYLIVSIIFWYVGMIPDLAATRDALEERLGPEHPRVKFYRAVAAGWSGAASQWRHYGRGYLFFAALATPLVVSVHSVVSWDFAMSLLPGWHTTIFAPYFVAGAIHSGLAMVLTLMIPMRKILKLERLVTRHHLEMVAKTIIVTTLIVGYAYVVEPFISWYSGDLFEQQFAAWRAIDGWTAPIFWALVPLNVLLPLTFVFRKCRTSLVWLFIVSILINVGMWLERLMIVSAATSHDFLPNNWHPYAPTWVEVGITVGSFAWFMFWFLLFAKTLPTVPATDLKEQTCEEELPPEAEFPEGLDREAAPGTAVTAVYRDAATFARGVERALREGMRGIETFTPTKVEAVQKLFGEYTSPVRWWTLVGGLSGLTGGYGLALYAAMLNNLIVGGKQPVSLIPYAIVGFEGTILIGSLANLAGIIVHSRLFRTGRPVGFDRRFTRDRFGLRVTCDAAHYVEKVKKELLETGAEEVHVG